MAILLFLFQMSSDAQENPQVKFGEANKQLEAGYYQKAIHLYRELETNKQWSGPLFLNMGISYQRLDSLGKAKFYFLKATTFEATEAQAQQALEYIDGQFSHQSVALPKLPWDVATDWLRRKFGARALLAWGIILLNMGVLLFISHWFLRRWSSYVRIVGISITALALLIIASGFYTQYIASRYSRAVMVTQQAPVLEKPKEGSSLISQSFEGYTFTVDHRKSQSQSNWSYVRMSNGLYGWIPNSDILIL
ncbi:MAG TPA: GW dipeptide domain-containing protein [Fodinibius sp.]|nr:GW dipeptide domain-containing protein [Fodinibius sp.]